MNPETIFFPLLLQIVLVVIVLVTMNIRKTREIKTGTVDRSKAALNNKAWSDEVIKVSNNLENQFQVPVLFYVVCLILFLLNAVNSFVLALTYAFVVSRYLHAYIHIGSNHVPHRGPVFKVGCYILLAMIIYTFWVLVFV